MNLGMAASARGEDPPPFAFEWGVDYTPAQLSIDPSGNLWILDDDETVHRTLRDGRPLDSGGSGYDVACTQDGNAYVLTQPFQYPANAVRFKLLQPDGVELCRGDGYGYPVSIALGFSNQVLVAVPLATTGRILRYTSTCERVYDVDIDLTYNPGDIAATDDALFVSDPNGHRVVIYDATGAMAGAVSPVTGYFSPIALAVDLNGNLFVATANTVYKFTAQGTPLYSFGGIGSEPGQFDGASGIAVNAAGDLYVSDANNRRIQMFGTRLPSDDPPPPPPPPVVSNKPPLTPHSNLVLLHIGALTDPPCFGPSSLQSVGTAEEVSPDKPHEDIVYLIASPDMSRMDKVCGVQVGIVYDPSVEIVGWHACSDLQFPADTWPASGSGNTMTWADNVETDVVVAGYFEVVAHGPSRMRVIPWPQSGEAKIASCRAAEYALEVPPDRLGWVSWGHAGYGTDTDGCNPVLSPCELGPVPVQPSTWGRLKSLYAH